MALTTMAQARRYAEFAPPALLAIEHAAVPLGFALVGMVGNDAHTYGAHLSQVRLQATGHGGDYTLTPAPGAANARGAAAIDLGTGPVGDGPAWAGEWLEWVRGRCQSGEFGFIGEIIGDPDLVPGADTDAHTALYATGPGWQWVPYQGQGHVAWCHLWIKRDRLSDTGLGRRLFEGWGPEGYTPATGESVSDIEQTVRGMSFPIPGHTYLRLGDILPAQQRVLDTLCSPEYRHQLVTEIAAEVIAHLRSSAP